MEIEKVRLCDHLQYQSIGLGYPMETHKINIQFYVAGTGLTANLEYLQKMFHAFNKQAKVIKEIFQKTYT